MSDIFFSQSSLNSPYEYRTGRWEADEIGQPIQKLIDKRRLAAVEAMVKSEKAEEQTSLGFGQESKMSEASEERLVSLRRSSWELLDEAAELWGGDVGETLDSVVQGFLATDDGRAVARAESLARLKKLFGENRG